MFKIFSAILAIFAYSAFDCFRITDVLLLSAACVPMLLYWRRDNLINILIMLSDLYTLSSIAISLVVRNLATNISLATKPVIVWFPNTDISLTGEEYVRAYCGTLQDILLLFMIVLVALATGLYFCHEHSTKINKYVFTKEDYVSMQISKFRDKMYALKTMTAFYSVLALLSATYASEHLINKWVHCFVFIAIILVTYAIVQLCVDKEWSRKILEFDEVKDEEELEVINLEDE